jgi:phosphatidate cytidylyltransferase
MTVSDRKNGSLLQRVTAALVFGPIILWIFWSKGIALYVFVSLITVLAQWELYRMFGDAAGWAHKLTGYAAGLALIADAAFAGTAHPSYIITASLFVAFVIEITAGKTDKLRHIALSLLAAVYPALFLTFLIRIAQSDTPLLGAHGCFLPLYVLLVIWVFDTSSYFTGRAFGKHRFFPSVSPKKTVEGFIGGIVGAVLFGVIYGLSVDMSYTAHFTAIAIVTALAGQAGDLAESVIKRDLGVKDSSHIIPGHGGILDRFDSLIFASPAVYVYITVCSYC